MCVCACVCVCVCVRVCVWGRIHNTTYLVACASAFWLE